MFFEHNAVQQSMAVELFFFCNYFEVRQVIKRDDDEPLADSHCSVFNCYHTFKCEQKILHFFKILTFESRRWV